MFFLLNSLAIITGILLDIIFAELPSKLHPVVYIGRLISFLEKILYYKINNKVLSGTILVIVTLFTVVGSISAIALILWNAHKALYFIFSSFVVFNGISIKCFKRHILDIKNTLKENNIQKARKKVSLIVSRDTSSMNKESLIKATIESLSENFVDSVFAPMLYGILGPTGISFFKTVSTLDSMIGYRNPRYDLFGKTAARLDDILCFLPARLSVLPVMLGSLLTNENGLKTLKSFLRFRKAHPSPNSAHSMSAFAGSLSVTLGGESTYFGKKVVKPLIKGGDRKLDFYIIDEALFLFITSVFCSVLLVLIGVLGIYAIYS